jgi:hypothetical protein
MAKMAEFFGNYTVHKILFIIIYSSTFVFPLFSQFCEINLAGFIQWLNFYYFPFLRQIFYEKNINNQSDGRMEQRKLKIKINSLNCI